jgi:hypothetical protein
VQSMDERRHDFGGDELGGSQYNPLRSRRDEPGAANPPASRGRAYCEKCRQDVDVAVKRRFVANSSGMQPQAVCGVCSRVL